MRVLTTTFSDDRGWSTPLPAVDPARSLTLCFGGSGFIDDPEPIRQLSVETGATVVGCSTSGEIHGTEVADDTLAVAVIEFERTRVAAAAVPISADGSIEAGRALARSLDAHDLRSVFALSDGLDVNGSDLVAGLGWGLSPSAVITGGLAGDGSRFERTWVLVDGKPASGYATAVGLYGDSVRVGHGSRGGWDIFGPERTVTRSERNVLYELDGKPALSLYKEYLGTLATELPAAGLLFPLSLRAPEDDDRVVRTILAVDEDQSSLVFAGDVPQGHRAQLMHASFDRLVGGAEDAAEAAALVAPDPGLVVAISCVGRRLVLGERTEEELEAVAHAFAPGTPQIGFYSYGEVSPSAGGACALHNQTMTLTTVGET